MQVQAEHDKLIISYVPKYRLAMMAAVGVAMLGLLAYKQINATLAQGDLIGISVGLAILLGFTCAFWCRTKFVFDKSAQTLNWEKKWLLVTRSGHIMFSEISKVYVTDYRDADSSGSKVIIVIGSKEMQLVDSILFSKKECTQVAEQINSFIGCAPVLSAKK